MQFRRRHLATASRSGAVGGKTTTPRMHSACGETEVAASRAPPPRNTGRDLEFPTSQGAPGRLRGSAPRAGRGAARRRAPIGQPRLLAAGRGLAARWRMCGAGGGGGQRHRVSVSCEQPAPGCRVRQPVRPPALRGLRVRATRCPRSISWQRTCNAPLTAALPAPQVCAGPRPGPAPRPPSAVAGPGRSAAEVRAAGAGPGRRGDDEQVPKVAVQTQGEPPRPSLPRQTSFARRDRPLRGAADTPSSTSRFAHTVALLLRRVPPRRPVPNRRFCSSLQAGVHSLPAPAGCQKGPSPFSVRSCVVPCLRLVVPDLQPEQTPLLQTDFTWVPERPFHPPPCTRDDFQVPLPTPSPPTIFLPTSLRTPAPTLSHFPQVLEETPMSSLLGLETSFPVSRADPHPTVPALPSPTGTDPHLGPVRVPILVPCPLACSRIQGSPLPGGGVSASGAAGSAGREVRSPGAAPLPPLPGGGVRVWAARPAPQQLRQSHCGRCVPAVRLVRAC